MEYRELDSKVKVLIKGKRLKLTVLLFACSFLALVLGLLPTLLAIYAGNDSLFMFLGIAVIIIMPVIQNTIYAMFLSVVRNERFTKAEIKYSCAKVGYHVGTYLVLYFLQLGVNAVVNMVFGGIPAIMNVVNTLVNVMMLCVGVFCAFAIFEGAKGIFAIINGSIRLMFKHWKNVLLFALPFLIWTLLVQLAYNMMISNLIGANLSAIEDVIKAMETSPILVQILVSVFGIYIIQYIGSAFLQTGMFTAYGFLFDKDFLNEYPTIKQRKISGQEIDINV